MQSATDATAIDAWLRWLQGARDDRRRASLYATCGLEPAAAEALINADVVPLGACACGRTECALHRQEREPLASHGRNNAMEPFSTLLLCLPAALVLVVCGCGVAALWPPVTRPTAPPPVGRRRAGRNAG